MPSCVGRYANSALTPPTALNHGFRVDAGLALCATRTDYALFSASNYFVVARARESTAATRASRWERAALHPHSCAERGTTASNCSGRGGAAPQHRVRHRSDPRIINDLCFREIPEAVRGRRPQSHARGATAARPCRSPDTMTRMLPMTSPLATTTTTSTTKCEDKKQAARIDDKRKPTTKNKNPTTKQMRPTTQK